MIQMFTRGARAQARTHDGCRMTTSVVNRNMNLIFPVTGQHLKATGVHHVELKKIYFLKLPGCPRAKNC